MVDDKFSCIKEVTKTVHIALPTASISNEINGICDVLESWKRQYIQQLQGIVVSYKNVSMSSVHGYIKIDGPVIHYDVKATFELFHPTAGSILKGKINRVSRDHIGCLVHNTINVTIDRPNASLGDISHLIVLDRIILFQITRLDFKGKIIRVRGKITKECIDLMKESDHFIDWTDNLNFTPSDFSADVGNRKRGRENSDVSNDIKAEVGSSHASPSKKKPKRSESMSPEKKLNICDIVQDSSLVFQNSSDTSSHVTSSKKKKKHKKSKNDVLSSPPLFNESLDSDANEIEPTQPQLNEFSIRSFMNDFSDVNPVQTSVGKEILHGISSPANSPQKKKNEQVKTVKETIGNNTLSDSENSSSDLETHDPVAALLASSTKIKKSKKRKEKSLKSPSSKKGKDAKGKSVKSPKKKHKKSKSNSTHKEHVKSSPLNIKEEMHTDSFSSLSSSKSKKTSENFEDIYEMMEALSSFEPPPEAQLLGNISPSKIEKKPPESPKKAKKRKRDSVDDTSSLPKKKRKNNDGSSSSKSKDKTQKEKKKKKDKSDSKKDKSEKDSKKDKKKKPKNKVISSKKKGHGYKVKLKKKDKEKKNKDKIKK